MGKVVKYSGITYNMDSMKGLNKDMQEKHITGKAVIKQKAIERGL